MSEYEKHLHRTVHASGDPWKVIDLRWLCSLGFHNWLNATRADGGTYRFCTRCPVEE